GPELAEFVPEAAMGDEMPVIAVVDEAERFDVAGGDFLAVPAFVLEAEHAAFGEGALDGDDGFAQLPGIGTGAEDGGGFIEPVEVILPIAGKDGADLTEG